MGKPYSVVVSLVINTQGTMEDESHLTLVKPIGKVLEGTLEVQTRVPEPLSEPAGTPPPGWEEMTPQERADDMRKWLESLPKDGPALSDFAVSRDGIYD